jgi:four helix bundle protein
MGTEITKPYRLEDRARNFALDVRTFLKQLPRTITVQEDGKQLIRSSGSIGANYIEAQESLGRKNCLFHLRIARKEAKESIHWLFLLSVATPGESESIRSSLQAEAKELSQILSAMIQKALRKEW